jgi:hypothetical protein
MSAATLLAKALGRNCLQCLFDEICHLRIEPLPDGVICRFRTCRPLVPIVEIFGFGVGDPLRDMSPASRVASQFPVFLGLATRHAVELGGLAQNRKHWYRITAGATVAQGTFRTGSRSASVMVNEIRVNRSGDPSSGEIQFSIAAYDAVRGHLIAGTATSPGSGELFDLGDGDTVTWPFGPGPVFRIADAPGEMTLVMLAADNDPDFGVGGILTEYLAFPPASAPTVSSQGTTPNEDWEWAEAVREVRVPSFNGGKQNYTLDPGNTGVAFTARGYVQAGITRPSEPPRSWPDGSILRSPVPGRASSGTLGYPGAVVAVQVAGRGRLLFAAGPHGTLFWQRDTPRRGRPRDARWTQLAAGLGSPVVIEGTSNGIVHLLAPGEGGHLAHARFTPWGPGTSALEWEDLGGPAPTTFLVVQDQDTRADVLCLDGGGRLHHRALDQARRWTDLGGPFRAVAATADHAGIIDVFGLSPDGALHTARLDPATPAALEWIALGGSFGETAAMLPAQDEDGQAMLVVVDADRSGHVKMRARGQWLPRSSWHGIGLVDALGREALAALERLASGRG